MKNILTVDVEDWYHANALKIPRNEWDQCDKTVAKNTRIILELFERYDVKATFFILGYVAKNDPSLVKEIAGKGHEIASHGMYHELAGTLSDERFREDVCTSKALLEDMTGQPVLFYRAPSWSIPFERADRLEILEEEGYLGDSSLQPFWTPLSGSLRIPCKPFYPVINGRRLKLLEIPPTVMKLAGLRIPFAGGFYLRCMPLFLVKQAMKRVNRWQEGVVYVHPWEFDEAACNVKKGPLVSFVHSYNIDSTKTKMEGLLQSFSFQTMGESLRNPSYSSIDLTS
ncbi:polysaccharide deacetylase family protein [Priestia abyssalis]|uniref:polysaccharide deacetylase family protein n=1 Tax=Priestia abyssalis TaxID=1221450 RepID=UPI000995116A|nr:polysaccharide deacetylase family protein [Priestia abyssalis]